MICSSTWKLLASFVLLVVFSRPSFAQEPKNVLLILSDDFNFWVNAMGYYPGVQTPNLDRLAEKGILFTQAYSNSPVCNPSRNAMMSGFRPTTTGILRNQDGFFRNVATFQNVVSLNQYFKEQNYYVMGGGKIFHNRMGNNFTDESNWSELYTRGLGSPGGDIYKWSSKLKSNLDWSAGIFDVEQAGDTRLARHMADFIENYDERDNGQPFFVAMGLYRPHLAWDVHKKFWDLYDRDDLVIPPGYKDNDYNDINDSPPPLHDEILSEGKWMEGIHAYLACLSFTDFNVGIVLDALENSPHRDNTIVVFAGDHGWHLGEKERWGKATNYDQASHTSFIVYDPGAYGNGQTCDRPVSLQDIYPTLVELTGLEPKTDMEGVSLSPLLANPSDPNWNVPAFMTYINTDMIRTQDFRLINQGARSQLYQLDEDPYEWENLIDQGAFRDKQEELRSQIDLWKQIGLDLKDKLQDRYSFQPKLNVLPGSIEAENYDEGVNHQTYFDQDASNEGGRFRQDGVDIYSDNQSSESRYIGDTQEGEWLQYTLYNTPKGNYRAKVRIEVNELKPNQRVEFFLGTEKVGSAPISNIGQGWQSVSSGILQLDTRKSRILRVEIRGGGFSMDRFDFEAVEGSQCFSFASQYQPGELDREVELNGECEITVPDLTEEISVESLCGELTLSQSLSPGVQISLAHGETRTITLTAIDNEVSSTYEVVLTGLDRTPPVPKVSVLPDQVGQCQVILTPPEAIDNCQNTLIGQSQDPLVYNEPGTYTVAWRYDDGHGQIFVQPQVVQVLEPAQIACPGEFIRDCSDPNILEDFDVYLTGFIEANSIEGELSVHDYSGGLPTCNESLPIQIFANETCASQNLPSCRFDLTVLDMSINDTQSPSQPGLIELSNISDSGAVLSWAPSEDNILVGHYTVRIYQGDSLVAEFLTEDPKAEIEALTPGISYRIEVFAVDPAGNESETRELVFATLSSPITHTEAELYQSWVAELFPNPFDQSLTLVPHAELCCPFSLRIFDLMGREIWHKAESVQPGPVNIESRNWAKGVYLMQIEKGGVKTYVKLVKN